MSFYRPFLVFVEGNDNSLRTCRANKRQRANCTLRFGLREQWTFPFWSCSVQFPFHFHHTRAFFCWNRNTHTGQTSAHSFPTWENLDNFPERKTKKTKATFTGGQDVNPPALPPRTRVEGRHFRRPSEMFIGPPSIPIAAGSDRLLTVSSGVNLVHAVPKATILTRLCRLWCGYN